MVNSHEERRSYKEDKAEEKIGFKEMVPLVPGMEAGEHQGDDEDHQHGGQEVLLGWSGGQAGGEVFTTLCKPFDGAIQDLVEHDVLGHVEEDEVRWN